MEQIAAKPPQVRSLPDILTPDELALIINTARELRYQVYILTTYSMGLRLGEALNLKVGDITYMDVGKGREPGAEASMPSSTGSTFAMARDARAGFCSCKTCIHHIPVDNRYVTLPDLTLYALRKYWSTHKNRVWLFKAGFTLPNPLPKQWVAHCKHVGRGLPALQYLSRYLYRGVISERNIIEDDGTHVTTILTQGAIRIAIPIRSKPGAARARTFFGWCFSMLYLRGFVEHVTMGFYMAMAALAHPCASRHLCVHAQCAQNPATDPVIA